MLNECVLPEKMSNFAASNGEALAQQSVMPKVVIIYMHAECLHTENTQGALDYNAIMNVSFCLFCEGKDMNDKAPAKIVAFWNTLQ